MKTVFSILAALFLLLAVQPARAAVTGSCQGLDSIANLMSPTKNFANGAVRIAYISTEEPAAAPDHLLVFIYGAEMDIHCTAVDADVDGRGFSSIDFSKLKASYDAKKGLSVSVPAATFDGENNIPTPITLTVNQQTGVVKAAK